jgi:hypothetical protein
LLIDEIDKADIEFPNDLLREIDRMEFYCYETRELIKAKTPAPGVHHLQQRKRAARRLFAPLLLSLHQIPTTPTPCASIVAVHFPRPQNKNCLSAAMKTFFRRSQPAWSEEKALHQRAARLAQTAGGRRHSARSLQSRGRQELPLPPLVGALLQNEQDVTLFEKLVFMQNRNR